MKFVNKDGWHVSLHRIEQVSDNAITVDDGWGLFVNFADKPPIDPGDVGVFYSTHDGWGGSIKGLFCNGIWYVPYQTKEESEAKHQKWLEDYAREKQERHEANIDKWLTSKQLLREPLRDRIQRFEDKDCNFWVEDGGYELFCCEQADRLLDFAVTEISQVQYKIDHPEDNAGDFIDRWSKLPYEQQAKMPGFDEGHSGNTFGAIVWLAKRVALGLDV